MPRSVASDSAAITSAARTRSPLDDRSPVTQRHYPSARQVRDARRLGGTAAWRVDTRALGDPGDSRRLRIVAGTVHEVAASASKRRETGSGPTRAQRTTGRRL